MPSSGSPIFVVLPLTLPKLKRKALAVKLLLLLPKIRTEAGSHININIRSRKGTNSKNRKNLEDFSSGKLYSKVVSGLASAGLLCSTSSSLYSTWTLGWALEDIPLWICHLQEMNSQVHIKVHFI